MKEYMIELEIFEGNSGKFRADGTYPDFVKEGICPWMYGRLQVGQKFRYPEDLGELEVELWAKRAVLEPGQSITLNQEIEIRQFLPE